MAEDYAGGRRAWATHVVVPKQKEATWANDLLYPFNGQEEEYSNSLHELHTSLQVLQEHSKKSQNLEESQRLQCLGELLQLEERLQQEKLQLIRELEDLQKRHQHRRLQDFLRVEGLGLYEYILDVQHHQELQYSKRQQLLEEYWQILEQQDLEQREDVQQPSKSLEQLQEQTRLQQCPHIPVFVFRRPEIPYHHQRDVSSLVPLILSSLPLILFLVLFGPRFLLGVWYCVTWTKQKTMTALLELFRHTRSVISLPLGWATVMVASLWKRIFDMLATKFASGWQWLCSKLPNLHLVFNRMLWHKTVFVGWMQTSATSPGGQTEALREEIDRQDITLHHLQLQIDSLMREKKVNQKQYQEYNTTIARTSSQLLGLAGSYSDLRQRIIPILDLRQRFESVDEELQAQKQTTASIEKDIRNLQRRQDWMTMFSKRDRHLQLKHNVAATPKPASEEINPISSFEETAAALGKQISIHKRYVSDSIRAIENRQAVQQAVLDSYADKLVHLSSLAVKPADPQTLAALEEQISFHKRHVTDTIRAVEKRQVVHQAVLDSYAAKLEHLSSLIEKRPEPPETCSSDEEIKALLEKKFKSVVTQSKNKFDIHEARITALEKDVYKPIQQTLPVEDRLENLEYDVGNSVDQLKDLTKQTSDTIDSISVLHNRVDNLRLDMKNVVRKATEDTTDPETVTSMSRDIEILHARIGNLKTLHNDSISNLSRELEEQVAKINAKIDADLNRVRSRWHHADKCRADRHNALDQSLKESLHTVSINYMGLKQHVDELKHGMIKLETGVADRLQLLIDTFLPDDEESPLKPSRARSNPSDRMRTSETVTLVSRILTPSTGLSEEMQHNTSDPAGAGLPDNQQQPTVGENTHADEGSASREDIDSSLLQIDTVADRVQKKVGYLTARYFALKDAFRTASFASRSSMPYENSAQAGIDKLGESAGIGSETDCKSNAGLSATIAADLDVGQEESFEQESRSLPSADNNGRVTLYRADLTSAGAPLVSSPSPWTLSSQISLMSPTSNSTLWTDRVISPESGSVHPLDTPFSNDTSAPRMETNALVTGGKHGTILHSSVAKEQPARSSINEQETFSLAEFERFKAGMERRLVILESDFRSHYASQTALITGISANHSPVSVNPHLNQPAPNVLSEYETAMQAVKTRMTGFEDLLLKANSRIILLESGMTQLVDDTQALLQSRLKHISILQTATDIKVNDLQNSVRVLNWMHRGLEGPPRQ